MNEASKCEARRRAEGFYERYIVGSNGIDVGCGNDPVVPGCRAWDINDGDAQKLEGVPDSSFDWVFSSHCLEHLRDPYEAIHNWWRVLKPGGFLAIAVPDEDLYEQGVWPGLFNRDHKVSFTLSKARTWSPKSFNLVELIRFLDDHKLIYAKITDANYDYSQLPGDNDQTVGDAEAGLEMVVQKMSIPEQIRHRSNLAQIMICPECRRMSLVVEGREPKKSVWQLRCHHCGWFGAGDFVIQSTNGT